MWYDGPEVNVYLSNALGFSQTITEHPDVFIHRWYRPAQTPRKPLMTLTESRGALIKDKVTMCVVMKRLYTMKRWHEEQSGCSVVYLFRLNIILHLNDKFIQHINGDTQWACRRNRREYGYIILCSLKSCANSLLQLRRHFCHQYYSTLLRHLLIESLHQVSLTILFKLTHY